MATGLADRRCDHRIMGPHQAYGNIPRSIQFATEWISDCVQYLRENDIDYIEATEEKVDEWTKHVHEISVGFLSNDVDSWYVLSVCRLASHVVSVVITLLTTSPG